MTDAKAYTGGSTSVLFAAHSQNYMTELVAFVVDASPQHNPIDQLPDFVVNLVSVPSTVVCAVVNKYWAADSAEKAVDAGDK